MTAPSLPRPAAPRRARVEDGVTLTSTLVSGPLVYGLLGLLLDHVLGLGTVLLPAGIVLGVVLSIYMVIRRTSATPTAPTTSDGGPADAV